MKLYSPSNLAILLFAIVFTSCSNSDPEPTLKERNTGYLVEKSGGWILNSIVVPSNSATIADEWTAFKLSFTASMMTTSGHPAGSQAVWPSGGWNMSDDGKTITRSDGVIVTIITLNETIFKVTFSVPQGTEISGRLASLEGDYTFDLK